MWYKQDCAVDNDDGGGRLVKDKIKWKAPGAGKDELEPLGVASHLGRLPETPGGDCEFAPMATHQHELGTIAGICTPRNTLRCGIQGVVAQEDME